MHSYWTTQTSINILFELCEENAETVFKKQQNYTQRYNYLIVLMFDILIALRELEKLNIIHRDIKPENILIKEGFFKLADLGLSRILEKGNNCLTNDIGNRLGRSPEFGTGKYSVKTDIWSLGVNIFYLLESTLPFDEESLLKIKNNPNDI
jgi:serine/threonine protein kinase